MIEFDYWCDGCGIKKNNYEMKSFVCKCGGTMRNINNLSGTVFKPYYHEDLKEHIFSSKHEKKVYKQHGVIPFGDCKKLREKSKFISKNREEIIKERYATQGIHYKPGRNVRWSDARQDFIPGNSRSN